MEINKLGSISEEYRQLAAQRQEKQAQQTENGGQTIDTAAGAKTMSAKAPPPSGQAAGGQNNAGGQQAQQAQAATQQAAIQAATTTTTEDDDDSSYEAIVAKADSGQTLTASELATLRAKDPTRYSKAVKAQSARENLRSQMEQTPNTASKTAREAISAIRQEGLSQAHGAMDEETANQLAKALDDEYRAFAKKYDQVVFDRPSASFAGASALQEDE